MNHIDLAPLSVVGEALFKAEREHIRTVIQPLVAREHIKPDSDEVISDFHLPDGMGGRIVWLIESPCDGCDGTGELRSNRGTAVECPDCDGDGYRGVEREIVTDYQGEKL